jgi:hypothetical protein
MSPFDYVKSVTRTKEDLYSTEDIFQKEYVPFIVNRALSNSPSFCHFAEALNKYSSLDKRLQYDFYLHGIPKSNRYENLWSKKSESDIDIDLVKFVASEMNLNLSRAIQVIELLGLDKVKTIYESRGGSDTTTRKRKPS